MYNNDSNSLNAGAPDIRLSGNQRMASYGPGGSEYDDHSYRLFNKPYNQLTPSELELFDLEMERLMQKVRSPQQNSGIMAAAPGTYTQNRKRQMAAGGGIMGSNNGSMLVAPTADGSRPGYGWLDNILDVAKKVGQTIVPGGETGYFDLYNTGAQAREPNILDLSKFIYGMDNEADPGTQIDPRIQSGGSQFDDGFRKALATILPGGDPGYVQGGLYNSLLGLGGGGGGITDMFSSALSPYLGTDKDRRVNPLYPLGIGAAVGKYVEGLPKDELPMDTTSIDPAAIAAAARGTDAEGAAAGLRFLPEQVTRAAQGGRIGYAEAGPVEMSEEEKYEDLLRRLKRPREMGREYIKPIGKLGEEGIMKPPLGKINEDEAMIPLSDQSKFQNLILLVQMFKDQGMNDKDALEAAYDHFGAEGFGRAEGGRIGYADGTREEIPEELKAILEGLRKMKLEDMAKKYKKYDLRRKTRSAEIPTMAAQGGRIGYAGAGPVRSPGLQDVSRWLFAKDVDTLTDDEYDTLLKFIRENDAKGGRVGRQEGGLMNLGGMEKDYRNEGGFVALGGEEKADDVPARLSKNEFVFTADAVRGAGGGDIDQGAEIMENMMKHLEAGGEVSEDSQGLEGARGMFANAQQLQKRII